ncbi:MAG: bifunctional riboflavin kinase/FAD synthetase [Candidatus Rokubacteria bacterium]|nr:bifunctional riboflavin kinase/FAD synthetase [Candidatus Rokubacteria bacterium]MBI2491594.1 bifunctional riboflavin kinase/FAD synthetase [Candidatus Rokubacteria bacterium]MBI4255663.1 bifunctional riboflavin kinase/FAD synthetase [Candidatus Rokubacteria bacterium]MBI4629021.1 bifunctional riboflavin kinase/FAD synthetase [Candidatus Rokubacteria bacterium]
MRTIRGLESYPPDARPGAVALGAFDGIHLGHRAILGRAVTLARERGLEALACTFDPHPLEVLQPDRAPRPITTLADRLDLIAETGIDTAVVVAFTRAIAALEPEAFVRDALAGTLRAREIVVGFNHRFGRGARGDARLLETLGPALGFRTHVVAPLEVDGVPVSSSEIRAALGRGDLERAARLLGRPYALGGEVVHGAGRGRTLGFPTANLRMDLRLPLAPGVYACRARVGPAEYRAVVNAGVRPTFGETELAVEAHLLDFSGDLYGQRIQLTFLRRLREERRFPSVEALREQIAADVAAARTA